MRMVSHHQLFGSLQPRAKWHDAVSSSHKSIWKNASLMSSVWILFCALASYRPLPCLQEVSLVPHQTGSNCHESRLCALINWLMFPGSTVIKQSTDKITIFGVTDFFIQNATSGLPLVMYCYTMCAESNGKYFDLCTSIIKQAPFHQASDLMLYHPEPKTVGMLCVSIRMQSFSNKPCLQTYDKLPFISNHDTITCYQWTCLPVVVII